MPMRTGPENRQADHQAHTVADFKKRFWISLIATVPILFIAFSAECPGPTLLFIILEFKRAPN